MTGVIKLTKFGTTGPRTLEREVVGSKVVTSLSKKLQAPNNTGNHPGMVLVPSRQDGKIVTKLTGILSHYQIKQNH